MEKKSKCWLVGVVMFIAGVVVGYWQAPRIMGWLEDIYDRIDRHNSDYDYEFDCCDDDCDCDCDCGCGDDEDIAEENEEDK